MVTNRHLDGKTLEYITLEAWKVKTYSPLHREKTEKKGKSSIPSSCLVNDTCCSKYIVGCMHIGTRRLRQKSNDDNW